MGPPEAQQTALPPYTDVSINTTQQELDSYIIPSFILFATAATKNKICHTYKKVIANMSKVFLHFD